jgi:mono/diheme cytochrome c family protein
MFRHLLAALPCAALFACSQAPAPEAPPSAPAEAPSTDPTTPPDVPSDSPPVDTGSAPDTSADTDAPAPDTDAPAPDTDEPTPDTDEPADTGADTSAPPPPPPPPPVDPVAHGREVFVANCAVCHGADGNGTSDGPSLASRVPGLSDDEIYVVIQNGDGRMPPFDWLPGADQGHLVAYLRATFGP